MPGPILLISPIASHPQNDRNSARIFAFGRLLQSAGFDVHMLCFPPAGLRREQQTVMAECWDYLHVPPAWVRNNGPTAASGPRLDDICQADIATFVGELHRRWRFRAVLCHFVWLSRALEALGDGVLKLLDSHDVYAGRHARLRAEGLDATGFSTSVAEEMRGLGRADIVLVADEESAAIFRARGHPDVRVIGHIVSGRTRLIRDRGAVTAGYFASACAANAVNFVQLRQHVARPPLDLRLLVAGEICSTLSEPAPFSSAGRLDHSDSFYDQIDIALNPESRRARLSIKSVEAISQGVPLIATRAAMTGLPSYHALHRLEGAEEVGMCLRGTRFGTTLRHDLATASRRAARDYAAIVRAAARDVIAAMNG